MVLNACVTVVLNHHALCVDLPDLLYNVPDSFGLSRSLCSKLVDELSYGQGEGPDQGLTEASENVVVHCTGKAGAVQRVCRQGDLELHGAIHRRVGTRSSWDSLDILDCRSIWRYETFDIEFNEGLLNWKNTG